MWVIFKRIFFVSERLSSGMQLVFILFFFLPDSADYSNRHLVKATSSNHHYHIRSFLVSGISGNSSTSSLCVVERWYIERFIPSDI